MKKLSGTKFRQMLRAGEAVNDCCSGPNQMHRYLPPYLLSPNHPTQVMRSPSGLHSRASCRS